MRVPPSPDGRKRSPIGVLARLGLFVVVSVMAGALAAVAAVPFVGGAGIATRNAVVDWENLPDQLRVPPLPQRTVILASDNSVLATIYYQNRIEVPLSQVAPVMRKALVAIEDSRFLDHHGLDLRGTTRALVTGYGGGSTLTQQYVKNVLINNATTPEEVDAARARTPIRKLRELRYALALEKRFTKDEILSRYLNIAYFGAGAYGVEAAARRYFSKQASQLTLPEAATLAGLVQQPVGYDPTRNPRLATVRRNVVLKRMAELGYITSGQAKVASKVPMAKMLKVSSVPNGCTSSWAPYFCEYVLRVLQQDPTFGKTPAAREQLLKRGGLTIKTTLDPKKQKAALEAVTKYIPIKDPSKRAAAIVMIDPPTGHVVAMAQNRMWGTKGRGYTTYNYAVDRKEGGTLGMQAGSTFKVFTLAAALEAGVSPLEQISSPSPKTFKDFVNCKTGVPFGDITVRNSTGQGTFDMRKATAYSINTYFMEIEQRAGLCRPADIAEGMGVRLGNGDPLLRVPSFTLGTMEVSPLSLAGAYAAFANHGDFCKPTPILEIRDRYGKNIYDATPACKQVVDRGVADTVTSMLTGVIDGAIPGRTGALMALGRPAAGKTGTTNDSAAVWFAGYTPDLAAAVWVGDPRGGFAHPMKDVTINGRYYGQVFGSTLPGPIWKEAMLGALDGSAPVAFDLSSPWGFGPARGIHDLVLPQPSASATASPSASASNSPSTAPSQSATSGQGNKPATTPKPSPPASPTPKPSAGGSGGGSASGGGGSASGGAGGGSASGGGGTSAAPKPASSQPKPAASQPKPVSSQPAAAANGTAAP